MLTRILMNTETFFFFGDETSRCLRAYYAGENFTYAVSRVVNLKRTRRYRVQVSLFLISAVAKPSDLWNRLIVGCRAIVVVCERRYSVNNRINNDYEVARPATSICATHRHRFVSRHVYRRNSLMVYFVLALIAIIAPAILILWT